MHTAEQTEKLFKNLASDYQKVQQALHQSRVGTDGPPALRNSPELYNVFDQYIALYFPQGGEHSTTICPDREVLTLSSRQSSRSGSISSRITTAVWRSGRTTAPLTSM